MSKSFSFVCVLAIIFCLCGCQAIPTDNKVRIIASCNSMDESQNSK